MLPNVTEMQVYPAWSYPFLHTVSVFSSSALENSFPSVSAVIGVFCADLLDFASASVWMGVKFHIHLFVRLTCARGVFLFFLF